MIQRPEADPQPDLVTNLECLLFVAAEAVTERRLAEALDEPVERVGEVLKQIQERYSGRRSGVHLVEIAGGWRMLSNPECAEAVAALTGHKSMERMSPAALETLAIVAYRQPVSRVEIERIRGVAAGPILRHMMELDLIRVTGREEALGRALLYGTTRFFLDRFGLRNIRDLPASLEV